MKRKRSCRPSFEISKAGHLLATRSSSSAGRKLATQAKIEKSKRLKRGCLDGTIETFKLSPKQKRNLPPALQKAIIAYHRKQGKKIIS